MDTGESGSAGLPCLVWLIALCVAASLDLHAAQAPATRLPAGGQTQWIDAAGGRIKTRVYGSADLAARPVLVLFLPGDLRNGNFQYEFAQAVAEGFSAVTSVPAGARSRLGADIPVANVVVAGVLRPGYEDADGDRSAGEAGLGTGDNYTREVSAALAGTISALQRRHGARAVVLVGHSGGGTLAANLLGDQPGLVDAALILACSCDVAQWRAKMQRERPLPIWQQPLPATTLYPLQLASRVPTGTRVRLVVGERDDVVEPAYSERYARALRDRGVDATVRVLPGAGHNIAFTRPVFEELAALVSMY